MLLELYHKNFLDETEKFTNRLLNRKDDVQKMISIALNQNKEEEFSELAFTAKYVKGLFRVTKKAPGIPEVENIDQHKRTDEKQLRPLGLIPEKGFDFLDGKGLDGTR